MSVLINGTKMAGVLIGEPTFTDAIAAIERADELSPAQRRHWVTSLRQMARYLDRPISLIPTRIAAIAEAVKRLHPAKLDVNPRPSSTTEPMRGRRFSGSTDSSPLLGGSRPWLLATAPSWSKSSTVMPKT